MTIQYQPPQLPPVPAQVGQPFGRGDDKQLASWQQHVRQAPALGADPKSASVPLGSTPSLVAERDTPTKTPRNPRPGVGSGAESGTTGGAPAPGTSSTDATRLRGTRQRSIEDFNPVLRTAPSLGQPSKQANQPSQTLANTPPAPTTSLPLSVAVSGPSDSRDPDRLTGKNVSATTPISADSPVLPGGKLVATFRNADLGIQQGNVGTAPRLDIRAYDAEGGAQGSIRVDRDTGAVSGSIHLGNGKDDLVFNGAATPSDGFRDAVTVTGFSGNLGLRVTINNPGSNPTPAGKPAPEGARAELIGTTGGKVVPSGSNLVKPIEAYVFVQESRTPGSLAGSSAAGGGVRLNDIKINPKGDVPITGSASLEVSNQRSTTAKGTPTEGLAITATVDLSIGKNDDRHTHGVLQPFVTVTPGQPTNTGVFGAVVFPVRF